MIEFNFILNFLDLVFLQGDLFGIRGEGPLGSADPLVKGMLLSAFAVIGFSIMLNLFNAGVRKKLVDSVKMKRIMKETRAYQKARMAAFKAKDQPKIDELGKKSSYMNKMSMEMMQMNMKPMMITIIPLLLIFYFLMPSLFSYTVAISPIPLNVIPVEFFQLTCTAEKMAQDAAAGLGPYCNSENEIFLWAWYFLTAIAFSGTIMKLTKTSMNE
uniref:Membrane protein-like protein n=1 Tax=uncultured marine thaumarchaeote KM3_190_E06 TaxID=1456078 RepID=A0A075GVD4_9ARCH|nr:membrane protein-like protein [uncultured marine thaumarchaeote KM3_190_E06]